MKLSARIISCPLAHPLRITGYAFDAMPAVVARLDHDGIAAEGEGAPLYYFGDTPEKLCRQIETIAPAVAAGADRRALLDLLPAGGARNAVDCAMWAMEARLAGRPVWSLTGLDRPRPMVTAVTLSVDTPDAMAQAACREEAAAARLLKLKLDGSSDDPARISRVRAARPDARLAVDANQGWSLSSLHQWRDLLLESGVELVEQPLRRGSEDLLQGLDYPIPLAADESAQDASDLPSLVGRFDIVNIKLDKCGGLTRALEMAREARRLGFGLMVGNMAGTALAAVPQYLLAQLCDLADLDGPLVLADRSPSTFHYRDGLVWCSDPIWVGDGDAAS